mmetsp:Transcript_11098/g.34272  ORF Transcript_11098/g.34272 Transcript_11098/m.34272 type:complete len:107 (+) Transcript_11098:4354-4674(+)
MARRRPSPGPRPVAAELCWNLSPFSETGPMCRLHGEWVPQGPHLLYCQVEGLSLLALRDEQVPKVGGVRQAPDDVDVRVLAAAVAARYTYEGRPGGAAVRCLLQAA